MTTPSSLTPTILKCLGAGLVGLLVPPVLGFMADLATPSEGGLNGLFTVVGLYVGFFTGPTLLAVAVLFAVVRRLPDSRPRR